MKKRTLIVSAALAAMSALGGVKDEVHGYTPKGYVQPKEPEVRERLEWFKDQKLALMMCLGLYSNIGIKESWPLCDSKASWSRVEVDWTADVDEFKRQYFGLIRSFNPVRFRPETWAKAADGVEFDLPAVFKADANADVFRIVH